MSTARRPKAPPSAPGAAGTPAGTRRSRTLALVAVGLVCTLVSVVAVVKTADRRRPPPSSESSGPAPDRIAPGQLLFRDTRQELSYGLVALAAPGAPPAERAVSPLKCARVHFAGGRGVCLTVKRNVLSTYSALVFDDRFRVLRTIDLAGLPSRVRVSPDGQRAATTVFVGGDSYATAGFSTRTHFVDLATGRSLGDLERFSVQKDGKRFAAVDFNFWGVTFAADPNLFYATLGTGGRTYLVEGDLRTRQADVVHDNVECPSLSPDGRRVAFKKSVGSGIGPVRWRLSVLDLDTMEEVQLAETRSVDDQVIWLDDDRVAYGLTSDGDPLPSTDGGQSTILTDTWVVSADGTGAPEVYLPAASSLLIAPA